MTTNTDSELYRLLSLLSPTFPTGAFAFSHGLEYSIGAGIVDDAESLQQWIEGLLLCGSPFVDSVLLQKAWFAVHSQDDQALYSICETAAALRTTAELALECESEGAALLRTLVTMDADNRITQFSLQLRDREIKPHYAVCLGVVAALKEIRVDLCLIGFLNSFCSNVINAAVKLIPLGQTQGQAVLAALETEVARAASKAKKRDLDDIGSACIWCDIHSSLHEKLSSRLFRS